MWRVGLGSAKSNKSIYGQHYSLITEVQIQQIKSLSGTVLSKMYKKTNHSCNIHIYIHNYSGACVVTCENLMLQQHFIVVLSDALNQVF